MTRYDESDARIRPGRNKARPRTKDRPAHAGAIDGMVVAVDRGRFTVVVAEGTADERFVFAIKARELGRKGVVVGDRVGLVGDVSGAADTLARLVVLKARTSLLRRTADDTDPTERAIVANADQVVIVQALADPPPRIRFIDRAMVAALDERIDPVLVLTKSDLGDDSEIRANYESLGIPIFTLSPGDEIAPLLAQLRGKVSVLIGHSGVGKSTLVNRLVPAAERLTGDVNDVTGRGRHTSTSAIALELPVGGWIVDTPGVRSFGLGHIDRSHLIDFFPELIPGEDLCPRGCSHREVECGLDAFVTAAGIPHSRLDSLRRLLDSLDTDDER